MKRRERRSGGEAEPRHLHGLETLLQPLYLFHCGTHQFECLFGIVVLSTKIKGKETRQ